MAAAEEKAQGCCGGVRAAAAPRPAIAAGKVAVAAAAARGAVMEEISAAPPTAKASPKGIHTLGFLIASVAPVVNHLSRYSLVAGLVIRYIDDAGS